MLLDAFLRQCQIRPDATALVDGDREVSFGGLLNRAQAVAAGLLARGIRPGQAVAVFIDRGIEATIAVFGVLLAGACYVPLDVKNPPQRLAFIVQDAAAKTVLGLGSPPAWLDAELWLASGACAAARVQEVEISADTLAAILYTSGSTGQPRGVALSHGAIAAFAGWTADLLALTADDRIASSTPFFFDLSTFDLYAALGAGAGVYFVPPMLTMAPAHLSAWLQDQSISGWYTVPSLLAFLAFKGNLQRTPLPRLRFLLFAGEVFPLPALTALAAALPDTALFNFFGPTETNVCCYWPVERKSLPVYRNIPIGLPAAGCELRIEPKSGELWVRGPTLASGYCSEGGLRPILNTQGWYATGDKASLDDGLYHFHGRIGRMLKCSGYRVEPAEIEATVIGLPGVKECAVIGLDDFGAGQRPALALTLSADGSVANVRKQIGQMLPSYMHPVRYLVLDALPRLSNGKLDYQTLKARFELPVSK